MAYYVGLDVSVKETSICILDDKGVNRRAIRDLIRGVNGGHCVCCFAALWRVCLSYSERVPKRMLAARPALF
jgi:hypothetical protein